MKFLLVTFGSRGEFQPFVALAAALDRRGHHAIIAAPPQKGFSELATSHGVRFVAIGRGWDAGRVAALRRNYDRDQPAAAMRAMYQRLLLDDVEESFGRALELADGARCVVSHYGQPVGRMVADTLGLPFVSAALDPNSIPSRFRTPPGPREGRLGRLLQHPAVTRIMGGALNSAGWRDANRRSDAQLGSLFNRVRTSVGLEPLTHPGSSDLFSPHMNLLAFSPSVVRPEPDWAPRHRVTGYWFVEEERYIPPPDVASFLAANPRPLAVTLGLVPGTLPENDGTQATRTILDAARIAGARVLIDPGGLELGRGELPDHAMRCDAPHSWLFPRVAGVVHHGGAGTTGSALRAGVPFVAVPRAWDQPFWSQRTFELGVAARPIPRRQFTTETLAERMTTIQNDADMRRRAAALGVRIRAERGADVAAAIIESQTSGTRPPSVRRMARACGS